MRSSWQEALLPSLTSRSPGQLLLGRHKQQIMTLKGHASSRAEKQFHSDGHVAGSFLNVGWLVRMREVGFFLSLPHSGPRTLGQGIVQECTLGCEVRGQWGGT